MKHVVGPAQLAKGTTPETLAEVIGPWQVPRASSVDKILAPQYDPLGMRLTASSLSHVHVELMTEHDVILLRCRECGTTWVPVLESGMRLPKNWWSCPLDKNHSHLM